MAEEQDSGPSSGPAVFNVQSANINVSDNVSWKTDQPKEKSGSKPVAVQDTSMVDALKAIEGILVRNSGGGGGGGAPAAGQAGEGSGSRTGRDVLAELANANVQINISQGARVQFLERVEDARRVFKNIFTANDWWQRNLVVGLGHLNSRFEEFDASIRDVWVSMMDAEYAFNKLSDAVRETTDSFERGVGSAVDYILNLFSPLGQQYELTAKSIESNRTAFLASGKSLVGYGRELVARTNELESTFGKTSFGINTLYEAMGIDEVQDLIGSMRETTYLTAQRDRMSQQQFMELAGEQAAALIAIQRNTGATVKELMEARKKAIGIQEAVATGGLSGAQGEAALRAYQFLAQVGGEQRAADLAEAFSKARTGGAYAAAKPGEAAIQYTEALQKVIDAVLSGRLTAGASDEAMREVFEDAFGPVAGAIKDIGVSGSLYGVDSELIKQMTQLTDVMRGVRDRAESDDVTRWYEGVVNSIDAFVKKNPLIDGILSTVSAIGALGTIVALNTTAIWSNTKALTALAAERAAGAGLFGATLGVGGGLLAFGLPALLGAATSATTDYLTEEDYDRYGGELGKAFSVVVKGVLASAMGALAGWAAYAATAAGLAALGIAGWPAVIVGIIAAGVASVFGYDVILEQFEDMFAYVGETMSSAWQSAWDDWVKGGWFDWTSEQPTPVAPKMPTEPPREREDESAPAGFTAAFDDSDLARSQESHLRSISRSTEQMAKMLKQLAAGEPAARSLG